MQTRAGIALVLLGLCPDLGCSLPAIGSGTASCDPGGSCGDGMVCNTSDNLCYTLGSTNTGLTTGAATSVATGVTGGSSSSTGTHSASSGGSGSTTGSSSSAAASTTGGTPGGTSSGTTGRSTGASSTGGGTTGGASTSSGRKSWAWVYTNWQNVLPTIASNPTSFTHISPAFYSLNYAYTSGVAYYSSCPTNGSNLSCTGQGANDFDGLTAAQFTAAVADAGLATVPLIYAGSENQGSDTGVQNILNNASDAGDSFITSMVQEAVANRYQGYNLDWELGGVITADNGYADSFVAFVNNFKTALAPHGMSLSVDVIVSNIDGTYCSSNNGYLDFEKLSTSTIDRVIIEDYTASLGTASTSCQSAVLSHMTPIDCPLNSGGTDVTFTGLLNFMCSNLPPGMVVIGVDSYSTQSNGIAGADISMMESYGLAKIAVWPQAEGSYPFLSSQGLVANQSDWYAVLAAFLAY